MWNTKNLGDFCPILKRGILDTYCDQKNNFRKNSKKQYFYSFWTQFKIVKSDFQKILHNCHNMTLGILEEDYGNSVGFFENLTSLS